MGLWSSQPVCLPPTASLLRITNRDLEGPMQFSEGLYATVPLERTSQVMQAFDIEKKRHIQRVRRADSNLNDIILSYSTEDEQEILSKLKEMEITATIGKVKLP
jgi:hypothetical protein